MTGARYRLGVVALHPVPYQAPFYRALARHPAVDPFIIYLDDMTMRGDYSAEFNGTFTTEPEILDGYRSCFVANWSRWSAAPVIGRVNPGVVREIARRRFDAVLITGYHHLSALMAMAAAKAAGARVLLRAEADLANPSRSLLARAKHHLLPVLLRQADAVMYSARRNMDYFRHFGVPETRLFPLLSSVDNDALTVLRPRVAAGRDALRASLGIPDDAVVVVYAGRFTERKRVRDPLLAMRDVVREHDNVWLLYVGDGPLRAELETQARNDGTARHICFAGFRPPTEVPRFLAASDLFVLPSGYDPTPKALNEAMVFGLPSIVSDKVGTACDLVRHGVEGLVYPAGDTAALSRAIADLAADPDWRARMGAAAVETVTRWSPQANAEGVVAALRACVGERPCAA
jgi:glycosyltransferase involved in cell wall biosynthesis